ncbi:MAG: DNA-binding response regulator, partial [Oscillospiraceae bacterium]|nr:DNA-binding response regulator [Oscillospiraceae bacterium]
MSLVKILIIDDDKNICDLLRIYLEKEGYSTIISNNCEEG